MSDLNIVNVFLKSLPSDTDLTNSIRSVNGAAYSYTEPKKTKEPSLIHASKPTASLIGISNEFLKEPDFLNIITGNKIIKNTTPYAMCYGGHQFGNWAGQLGDGRAINLTEIQHNNKVYTLQLKGAGPTPYSRSADGLAVLRSSIREYLCSEAMHHLGIPTTRALSIALTGDKVLRDILYNGNPAYEKGAIVCRVSPTFLRFGSYEIHTSKHDYNTLKSVVDYTIDNYFKNIDTKNKKGYLKFFEEVSNLTLEMIIHWQKVGFVHGVMNTDNMSILGLTIDYGPYGWLEAYDFGWTPNTTDSKNKRYRFGNQPNIGLWNLLQLANALYPLIEDAEALENILNTYNDKFHQKYETMMKSKLGIFNNNENDKILIKELEENLHLSETDMTIFFRNLSNFKKEHVFKDNNEFLNIVSSSFYYPSEIDGNILKKWRKWFMKYALRLNLQQESNIERKKLMDSVNPKYILRNYISQLVIDEANKGNYSLLEEIYTMLKKPYDEQPKYEKWFVKRPEWARNRVGCAMLSCSS